MFRGTNILVTGGTGLIGIPLVEMLLARGAKVTVISLDDPSRAPIGCEFIKADLREFSTCVEACRGKQIVFHLAGVKGSPKMTSEKPASFFVPTLQFSINMMEAARRVGVERFLYTSSIGVYSPAPLLREDDVWNTFPSPNDRFAGWAKRMGELQAEAYKIEHGWDKISIVRPANVYGPYDNFNEESAMVIPSLIARVVKSDAPLKVWGDGSAARDFIHARDVARGMIIAIENGISEPLNIGSGIPISIRDVVDIIHRLTGREIIWGGGQKGDDVRLMDISRAKSYGFECKESLESGIKETMSWLRNNKISSNKRYIAFDDP